MNKVSQKFWKESIVRFGIFFIIYFLVLYIMDKIKGDPFDFMSTLIYSSITAILFALFMTLISVRKKAKK